MVTKNLQIKEIANSVDISAADARRLVNQTIVPDLGTGLGAKEPDLMFREGKLIWRVPVALSLPGLGDLGEVGIIDVDAETGQIISDETVKAKIIQHAQRLYAGAATLSPE